MKIVSFTGPKGSGKDTAAAIMQDTGMSLGKISFAGPMKEILSRVYQLPMAMFEDPDKKERPFEMPVELNLAKAQSIALAMLDMLPPEEFYYSNGVNFQGVEQTKLLSPRHMLQFVGTEMIRNLIHPDWHVAAAFGKDRIKLLPPGTYCVTDARFPNEYLWLKQRFGEDFQGFYVERPEAEVVLSTATHQSELQVREVRKLIPSDNVLRNNGSIEELKLRVFKALIKGNN